MNSQVLSISAAGPTAMPGMRPDREIEARLGVLPDTVRAAVDIMVMELFVSRHLDRDTALDLRRGLHWVHSGRTPAPTWVELVDQLARGTPAADRRGLLERAQRRTPGGRRPGKVHCPDSIDCEQCRATQQLADLGHRVALVTTLTTRCELAAAAATRPALSIRSPGASKVAGTGVEAST